MQITHYANEAEAADRVVNLSDSVDNTSGMVDIAAAPRATTERSAGAPIIELDRVGHTYAAGTPWAKTALRDITFRVHAGDGVLIHGGNGMRTLVNDYANNKTVRRILLAGVFASTAILIILGTLVIYTFDPCPVGAAPELLPSFCPVP